MTTPKFQLAGQVGMPGVGSGPIIMTLTRGDEARLEADSTCNRKAACSANEHGATVRRTRRGARQAQCKPRHGVLTDAPADAVRAEVNSGKFLSFSFLKAAVTRTASTVAATSWARTTPPCSGPPRSPVQYYPPSAVLPASGQFLSMTFDRPTGRLFSASSV
jgi:hypothetical protein